MGINECVLCANFREPRSRDRELRDQNATGRKWAESGRF